MSRILVRLAAIIGMAFAASLPTASATLWELSAVNNGSDSGFGYSLFHDASGSNVMSGATLGNIISDVSGTYDDVTGSFDVTLIVDPTDGAADMAFSLAGILLFDGSGFLASDSSLYLDFANAHPTLIDSWIGFLAGDVCCSGSNDPNSLAVSGNQAVISLWGADGFDLGQYYDSNLGVDLRLTFTQVPVPAAFWLFMVPLLFVTRKIKSNNR